MPRALRPSAPARLARVDRPLSFHAEGRPAVALRPVPVGVSDVAEGA